MTLRGWKFHKYVKSVSLAGSHAKDTDLRDSDVDIFIQLAPDTPASLKEIQRSLAEHFIPYGATLRNVSVRVTYDRMSVDLVPARGNMLWQARFDTWLKTDIADQIRYVRDSGFIDEILALKIWRRRHALRFPSFLMELAAIHALSRAHGDCPPISKSERCMNRNSAPKSASCGEDGDCPPISKNERCMNRNSTPKSAGCPRDITQSFPALLHFLATDFPTTRLLDPANSNNVVSDLLTDVEKLRIARRARLSLW